MKYWFGTLRYVSKTTKRRCGTATAVDGNKQNSLERMKEIGETKRYLTILIIEQKYTVYSDTEEKPGRGTEQQT